MPKFPVKLIAALALAGVGLGDLSSLPAQDAEVGIVNISDTPNEPITESEPLPTPGEADADFIGMPQAGMDYPGMMGYPGMPQAGMGFPGMPQGSVPIQKGKDWYGYQNHGPNWMMPIRRPIYRQPVEYARYWPRSYYTGGNNSQQQYAKPLPVIYQPTDTTQLGFYHQQVPQWQPRPNAIPGAPCPPNWHYTVPIRYGYYKTRNRTSVQGQPYGNNNGNPYGNIYGASPAMGFAGDGSQGFYPSADYSGSSFNGTVLPPGVIQPDGTEIDATPTKPNAPILAPTPAAPIDE